MLKTTLWVICILLVSLVVTAQDGLFWHTDIQKAFQEAQNTNRPLFVDCYTEWCSWCKKLEKETFSNPKFIELASKFVLLKVDGDKQPNFCTKYQVRAYPTMLFLKKDGTEIRRIKGFVTVETLVPIMLEVLKDTEASRSELPWFTDINLAFQNAAETNRLVFVDFYTEWCSWCKKLDQQTFVDPEFQAISSKFVLLKVDGDKQLDFCTKYKVRAYPTMLFLRANGEEVKRIIGFVPATTLVPVMKDLTNN